MKQPNPTASRLQRAAHWSRKELLPLLVLLVLMTAARSSFANHYQVPSGSMQPTLGAGRPCGGGHACLRLASAAEQPHRR
ncbi:hypothetical protein GGR61_003123 [Xanthomonas arboricola]|nr:hypothetical protein [Xanthomonas sp. 3058]